MTASGTILAIGTSLGGGDWPPLAAAVSALVERGHRVDCLGDAALARLARGSNLTITKYPIELDPVRRFAAWIEGRKTDPSLPPPLAQWFDDVAPFVQERCAATNPAVVLVQDFSARPAITLRERNGTPVCLVHATYFVGAGSYRTGAQDFAPGAPQLAASLIADALRAADLALIATDELFDPPPVPRPENHYWVGPLIWEPVQEVPAYLAEPGDPWVLVTLSSGRQDGECELARSALDALADQRVRVLLTLADTGAQDELGALPANARVEPFVPHASVLRSAVLCVSHAGHGIAAKALYFGVPSVLVPWDRDQPGVAARAEALGVARVVPRERLSVAELAGAIRAALNDPQLRARCAAHGERIRAYAPMRRACELIEATFFD